MKKILLLALTLISINSFASTTYYSDGTTATTNGDTTYFSDSTTATRSGDTVYYSDGSTATITN